MAIQKEKTLANGAVGNYWKIIQESYDKVTGQCVWVIALFKDRDHCRSTGVFLGAQKTYRAKVPLTELAGDRTALGYEKIKESAARMVPPINGQPGEPAPYDSDLVGGTDV